MTVSFVSGDDQLRQILLRTRRIAVVGLSPRINRPSYQVASALQRRGYDIVPVRPAVENVLGEKAYPTLRDVPGNIDMVDVFRAAEFVPDIVDACIALGVRTLWLQDGIVHKEAAARAAESGMEVVMDRCTIRDYRRLFGDQTLADLVRDEV